VRVLIELYPASHIDKMIQVAFEDGTTTSYALLNAQERGLMFVSPGQDVYKGQIVGIHQRPGDLSLNVCKKKAATNVRSNKETTGKTFTLKPQQFNDFHCYTRYAFRATTTKNVVAFRIGKRSWCMITTAEIPDTYIDMHELSH
jgi:hypothetical protein